MKKLILTGAILLGGIAAMTAQEKKTQTLKTQPQEVLHQEKATKDLSSQKTLKQADAKTKKQTLQEYKAVDRANLPQAVQEYVKQNHKGATISKAAVNANGMYQLDIISSGTKAPVKVYVDKNGKSNAETLN